MKERAAVWKKEAVCGGKWRF